MMHCMSDAVDILGLYLHLARASELRRRPHVNDRLLLISGAIAAKMQMPRVAAYCRWKVLQHNPRHLLGRWPSIAAALRNEEFLHLLKQLQRRFPQEKAEQMLKSLGIERASERDAYFSDEEYAAALLGVTPDLLDQQFGEEEAI